MTPKVELKGAAVAWLRNRDPVLAVCLKKLTRTGGCPASSTWIAIGMPLPVNTCPDVGEVKAIGGPELLMVMVDGFDTLVPSANVATTFRFADPLG